MARAIATFGVASTSRATVEAALSRFQRSDPENVEEDASIVPSGAGSMVVRIAFLYSGKEDALERQTELQRMLSKNEVHWTEMGLVGNQPEDVDVFDSASSDRVRLADVDRVDANPSNSSRPWWRFW